MISTWSPTPRARVTPPCLPEVSTASSSMSDRRDGILAEFEQHATGRRGMHENVKVAAGADFDLVRDKAHAFTLQLFEGCRDVVHVDGNVMESFAALRDEFVDNRIFGGSFQKFQPAFARRHHRSANFFVLDHFLAYDLHAKFLVKLASLGNTLYRDAQMIDLKHASLRS